MIVVSHTARHRMVVLADLLEEELKVVFCGTAAGDASAKAGSYYAGRGNRFWPTPFRVGLTPKQLWPAEYPQLLEYGIGLTDLTKSESGADKDLTPTSFGVGAFEVKLKGAAPQVVAFNGKRAARVYYRRPVDYGLQPRNVVGSKAFVLPSTSGAARRYWDESHWRALAEYLSEPLA